MATSPHTARRVQRLGGLALLLGAGFLSLPAAAALFDREGSENLILPVQVAVMALLGSIVGAVLPGLADGSRARRMTVGAAIGVGMAIVGVVLFFLLLSSFDGA